MLRRVASAGHVLQHGGPLARCCCHSGWAEVPRAGPWWVGRCIFMYHQAVVMLIFLNVLFSSVPACSVVAKSCHWVEALCLPDIHHNIF